MRNISILSVSLWFSALALLGCDFETRRLECGKDYIKYACYDAYHHYYGWYQSCRAYRYHHSCDGARGSGSSSDDEAACGRSVDCERGEVCDDGVCSTKSRRRGRSRSSGGVSDAGSAVDAGGVVDAGGASTESMPDAAAASSSEPVSGASAESEPGAVTEPSASTPASDDPVSTGNDGERRRRFGFACVRDAQCGQGQCDEGECFQACVSDAECGTGDRCAVESGRRICEPDVTPALSCSDSSDCESGQTCVSGTCHPPCDFDSDCTNVEDRCLFNLCTADRRPIAECSVNSECSSGDVCVDGLCANLGTAE